MLKWDSDLNLPSEKLAFIFRDQQLFAQHGDERVTRERFASLVEDVKHDCTVAATNLLKELNDRSPSVAVLDARGSCTSSTGCKVPEVFENTSTS